MEFGHFYDDTEWLVGNPRFVGSEAADAFHNGGALKLADEGKTVIFMKDEEGIISGSGVKRYITL